jgi:thiol-disulfide isomerase/thioredoxin
MNVTVPARTALRGTSGLILRHKIISSSIALFAAAAITVSLVTTSSAADGSGAGGATSHPAAAGFALPELGGPPGATVSLAGYAGKPLIVNFWASWCEPCQQETPLLASWYKTQHGKVALVGLDENDSTAKASKFVQAKGVSYPVGFDPNMIAAGAYNIDALPQTFFLNAKHQIVDYVAGPVTEADLAKGKQLMNARVLNP